MNKLQVALLVLVGCAAVQSLDITADTETCWDSPASQSVSKVAIDPCDISEDGSCILWKGRNSTISLEFTLAEDAPTLTSVVKGNVFQVEWSMPKFTEAMGVVCKAGDTTSRYGVTCPVKAGVKQQFSFSLPVSENFPSWSVPVLWRFTDAEGNTLLCVQMSTSLQTPQLES